MNLARSWRSKHLNEVVGQELAVRLVKNSLYRNFFFPVYLLSGMRGCGKTTVARLFALAVNCHKLPDFQKKPQEIILPCLTCPSCKAAQTQHPDIIEIDAASHTGVDTIRQLIDTASFMPILGSKKVYIIDEVHMLSKAAFNALLKVLEEPPTTVLFMLATTDVHKVIDTVKSRCFQLFFNPLPVPALVGHLERVCTTEQIPYEKAALETIAYESEGSVRDALNIIERVRLAAPTIAVSSVEQTLGFLPRQKIVQLFNALFLYTTDQLLALCVELNLERYSVSILWKNLVELLRCALWFKQGITLQQCAFDDSSKEILQKVSLPTCIELLDLCYKYELTLSKTVAQQTLFEVLLCKLNELARIEGNQHQSSKPPISATKTNVPSPQKSTVTQKIEVKEVDPLWNAFIQSLQALEDPLISSIFSQGRCSHFSSEDKTIELSFPENLTFFKEWLESTENLWKPLLLKVYPCETVRTCFTDVAVTVDIPPVTTPVKQEKKEATVQSKPARTVQQQRAYTPRKIDKMQEITQFTQFPKTQQLLKLFPGKVYLLSESAS